MHFRAVNLKESHDTHFSKTHFFLSVSGGLALEWVVFIAEDEK